MKDINDIQKEVSDFRKNLLGFKGIVETLNLIDSNLINYSKLSQEHIVEYKKVSDELEKIKKDMFEELKMYLSKFEIAVQGVSNIESLLNNKEFIIQTVEDAFNKSTLDVTRIENTIMEELKYSKTSMITQLNTYMSNLSEINEKKLINIEDMNSIIVNMVKDQNKELSMINNRNEELKNQYNAILESNTRLIEVASSFRMKQNIKINLILVMSAFLSLICFYLLTR